MKQIKQITRAFAFTLIILPLLTACMGPETPQEVTEAFWQAVLEDDAAGAVEYSTLTDARNFDAFDRDWSGYQPSFGRIVIEGDEAAVDSRFTKPGRSEDLDKEFVTYLVKQEQGWVVDYARTARAVRGGALGELFGKLNRIGEEISATLKTSSDELSAELERMGKELEQYSESLSEQAESHIDRYSESLRESLEELEESVRRALEDNENNLSKEERQTLTEVADDLDTQGNNLEEPSLQSISDSGQSMAKANIKLGSVDNKAVEDYKEQWKKWTEQFESDMQQLLEELTAQEQ